MSYNNSWSNYNWNNYWYGRQLTIQEAMEIANQVVPGQVIEAEIDTEGGILVYEVEIDTSFGIYEVKVNAYTGAIMSIEFEGY